MPSARHFVRRQAPSAPRSAHCIEKLQISRGHLLPDFELPLAVRPYPRDLRGCVLASGALRLQRSGGWPGVLDLWPGGAQNGGSEGWLAGWPGVAEL